jgi:hypothetical protein
MHFTTFDLRMQFHADPPSPTSNLLATSISAIPLSLAASPHDAVRVASSFCSARLAVSAVGEIKP